MKIRRRILNVINILKTRRVQLEIINILFIALWGYAAFSKVFEFGIFRSQLIKSPLLSQFELAVAIAVPTIEIAITILLLIDRTKLIALYVSAFLLTMFTIYLFGILNFSKDLPCSCGGILKKLSWGQHIIFNIGFIMLATIGIVMKRKSEAMSGNFSSSG